MVFRKINHASDWIFTITLFGIYLIAGVLLVLLGANVYQQSAVEASDSRQIRTSLSYITEKVRQCDHEDSVSIFEDSGVTALALHSQYNGSGYTTYIYCDEGYLKELFTRDGLPFEAAAGNRISPLQRLGIQTVHSLIKLSITDSSYKTHELFIHPNTAQGGVS